MPLEVVELVPDTRIEEVNAPREFLALLLLRQAISEDMEQGLVVDEFGRVVLAQSCRVRRARPALRRGLAPRSCQSSSNH